MARSSPACWRRSALCVLLAATSLGAQDAPRPSLSTSPGNAIDAAARQSITGRPDCLGGENGGVEILSGTDGVDFCPYFGKVLPIIRKNWYAVIPADDQLKTGKLAIEFSIRKDGKLADMKLVATSGDLSLDRAAWGAVTSSDPLPGLPETFQGDHITVRLRFYYNPGEPDHRLIHAILIDSSARDHTPKYPKEAASAKVDGIVRLEAKVSSNGRVEDLHILEGNAILANASLAAIKKWRFHPAQRDHAPIEDLVRIKVEFRLDGERVRAQVVWPEALPSTSAVP